MDQLSGDIPPARRPLVRRHYSHLTAAAPDAHGGRTAIAPASGLLRCRPDLAYQR